MPELDVKDLVVIDESGFPLNMVTPYGRCKKGKRLKLPAPLHGKNISVIGAIDIHGIIEMVMYEGSTDALCIETFMREILVPKLVPGKIIILDNSPVHEIERLNKEIFIPAGLIALPLPRYSPDFSPIEMVWSKMKGTIKRISPSNIGDLYEAINYAASFIDEDDIHGWFEHCGYEVQ